MGVGRGGGRKDTVTTTIKRLPQIGDTVTIHAALCEWDRTVGTIVVIGGPDDSMPYLVERADYYRWPFEIFELELHSLEDEAYEGGWER